MKSSKQPRDPPPPESQGFRLILDADFLDDLRYWTATSAKVAGKLLEPVEAVRRDPFHGIGKPEPLKGLGSGVWSRRITGEHRFVYRVEGDCIYLLQGRYHY
ncbi:MAG: Txe/YoeB family addiction module toxin [Verrucomicrobia bacterium]|nr:Txe/YoeB family addiction module toxin [Verrucomicrobiota bacterium]